MSLVRSAASVQRHLGAQPCVRTVLRYHRQQAKRSTKKPKNQPWVPAAYRGPKAHDASSFSSKKPTKVRSSGRPRMASRSSQRPRQNERIPTKTEKKNLREQAKALKGKKEKLITLQNSLVTLVKEYKKVLSTQSEAALQAKIDQVEEKEFFPAVVEKVLVVTDTCHKIDEVVTWKQTQDSEDIFRGIMRVLQDTVWVSLALNKCQRGFEFGPCLELAALALKKLAALRQERSLIVETARRLQSQTSDHSSTGGSVSAIRGIVSSILSGILGSGGKEGSVVTPSLMAHEDPQIGLTLSLFQAVVEAIEDSVIDETKSRERAIELHQSHQAANFAAANRLIELLDCAPEKFAAVNTKVNALEMLIGVGTLESARLAHRFFMEGQNPEVLRFTLVLRAYVEATRAEVDKEARRNIARECYEAVDKYWESASQTQEIDRLVHCGLVLRCFSFARMGSEPGTRELVDNLVERALGYERYSQLMQEVASDTDTKTSLDIQVLPILNYLVHIYSSSHDLSNIKEAKRILNHMCQSKREGLAGSILYPNIDTFNCIIQAIVEQYEKQRPVANDSARRDLELASSFLDYMLLRSVPGCLPNDESFLLMFRLIRAVGLDDMSDWAENLLAKMEVRQTLSKSSKVTISLSVYHRVLGCLLEGAKSGTADRASERAMELLERLEVQSLPLFLSIKHVVAAKVQDLYKTDLRPTQRTYKLLLRICAETTKHSEKEIAASIAQAVIERMVQQKMLTEENEAVDLFRACLSSLPDDSTKRLEGEVFLKQSLAG